MNRGAIMTSDTERLLQASIEIIERDQEIAKLKNDIAIAEARIAILQCKLQRLRVPFRLRETPGQESR
jgi:hypothetical protein